MKLKLQPDPTFRSKVSIPVPGDDKAAEVEFTFKFRTRDQLTGLMDLIKTQDRVAIVMEMAVAWDLADTFTPENVGLMDQRYIGALDRVVETYWTEHTKAIEKN
jgi:hypothetical protein